MHLCFSGLVGWSVLCRPTCVFLGELAGAYCAPVFFWASWLERIVHLCFSGLDGWSVLCTCVFLG